MRPIASDLSTSQRAQYALRQIVTYGGVQYAAYYLRRIDFTGVATQMEINTVLNNVTNTTPFVANSSNLNPTPPALNSSGVNVVSGNYASSDALVALGFSTADAAELINVAQIIYGDPGYAIISEVGLVSGVDAVVAVNAGTSGAFNMAEVIAAQIVSFVNNFLPVNYLADGTAINLNVGSTEPLFSLSWSRKHGKKESHYSHLVNCHKP